MEATIEDNIRDNCCKGAVMRLVNTWVKWSCGGIGWLLIEQQGRVHLKDYGLMKYK